MADAWQHVRGHADRAPDPGDRAHAGGIVTVGRPRQQDRLSVALAAVTCGRLSNAEQVSASRGPYLARADKYGVNVTDGPSDRFQEPVLELWGADMMSLSLPLKGPRRRSDPVERARVAARTMRDYDLDTLQVAYPDGLQLSADRHEVVLAGPRKSKLRRRVQLLLRADLGELL